MERERIRERKKIYKQEKRKRVGEGEEKGRERKRD